MITQLLFTLFCTVFFCLGLCLVTSEGYILYFLRLPFKLAYDFVNQRLETIQSQKNLDAFIELHPELKEQNDKTMAGSIRYDKDIDYYVAIIVSKIGEPLITCITCTGSVWGFAWFSITNGVYFHLPDEYLVINCFAASFIQTFIWNLYAKTNL